MHDYITHLHDVYVLDVVGVDVEEGLMIDNYMRVLQLCQNSRTHQVFVHCKLTLEAHNVDEILHYQITIILY